MCIVISVIFYCVLEGKKEFFVMNMTCFSPEGKMKIIITCDPSIYKMDHRDLIVCSFLENPIGLKGLNNSNLPTGVMPLRELQP